jgi:hypothetical protein
MIGRRPRQLLRRTVLALGYHPKAVHGWPCLQGKHVAAPPPPGNNWPLPPDEAERLFSQASIELLSIEPTSRGVAGALEAKIAFPDDGRRLQVKRIGERFGFESCSRPQREKWCADSRTFMSEIAFASS